MSAFKPFVTVSGTAVALPADDIDTDRIIPARYLKAVTFDGLGEALFYDERFTPEGEPKGHPLDEPARKGATVLVSGANFGCGSSREHAPQAIYRAGFRAVVAGSFAEIFFGNSTGIGLACVRLAPADLADLTQRVLDDPALVVTVDLEALRVEAGGRGYAAAMPESARTALTTGTYDPLAELLEGLEDVKRTAAALGHEVRW